MESAGEMALATKARRKANLHQTRSFIAEQLFCPFDATFKDILIRCKARQSKLDCCCGRHGLRVKQKESSSWRPKQCSGNGRLSSVRSSTSTGQFTMAGG